MIVGEAPGEREEMFRKPFVGPSGKRLNMVLEVAGVPRHKCYVTNVIKVRPPANDVERYLRLDQSRGKVSFATDEYKYFEKELYKEVLTVKPNIILALGALPLYALTRKFKPTCWRGSVVEGVPEINGTKVISTYHPSAALRSHPLTYIMIVDAKKVMPESTSPLLQHRTRVCRTAPTFDEATLYLDQVKHFCSMTAFDIEVYNEQVYCISFAKSSHDAMCIPFVADGGSPYYTEVEETQLMVQIADILADFDIIKVGQNLSFDITFLLRKYGILTFNFHDTMIAQGILWPEFPKGLDFITSLYTDQPYYKDEGKKWMKIGGTNESFWHYNCLDSLVCLEAFPKIQHELEIQGNWPAYLNQIELIEPLAAMHYRGIRMDTEGLAKMNTEYGERIKEITLKLRSMMGETINLASTKQLMNYFYKGSTKAYVNRATGKPTIDADALKRLSRKGFLEASLLIELRQLEKMCSTYFNMKLDDDNRLRCSYNPVGSKNGRLSSSKTIFGTGGNMQNQPPIMKRAMLADQGYLLYNVDLAKAENHVVAYLGFDENMIMAFEKDLDLHSMTAALIFGIKMDEVSNEPGSSSLASGKYSQRFWGKKANHGLNYGLGYKKFAYLYEIPETEARFIVERYHTAYPGVARFQSHVRQQLQTNRTVVDLFGKKRVFFDRLDDTTYSEAYSFIPQSTIAHIINHYGIEYLHQQSRVELLNQVHDSLVFQIPLSAGLDYHAQILWELKNSLAVEMRWMSFTFHLNSDIQVGVNAYDLTNLKAESSDSILSSLTDYATCL